MRRVFVALLVAGMVMVVGVGAQQKPQEVALQAAIRTETVSGDLKAAIAQYQAIVDKYYKTDRAVVANALVRMADCHQKLGDAQATALFERVLREFADQKQAVTVARGWLDRSKAPAVTGMTDRQVWTGEGVDSGGTISADGRYVSFTDWETGDLMIRDLSTATNRRLTNNGRGQQYRDFAEESAISRDGALIAYSWFSDKSNRYELRLLKLDNTAGTAPRILLDNPDVGWIAPYDWSPDGKALAVQVQTKDRMFQIGFVAVADGSFKPLKSIERPGTTRMFLSPDGSMLAYDVLSRETGGRDVFLLSADGSRQIAVAPHPADEMVVGWVPDGRALLFASDRAGSTGLWSVAVLGAQPGTAPRLIKADLGHLVESLGVTRSGSLLYGVRASAATVATAAIDLSSGTLSSPPALPFESYLSIVRWPDWSPDGNLIVAVSERLRNRPGLTIRRPDGTRVRDLSPAMWSMSRPRWAPDGSITVQGGDLLGRQGLFRIDAQSGEVSPILVSEREAVPGQPSWLPDGKSLVFRRNRANMVSVVVRNIASGEERILIEGPIRGLSVSPDGLRIAYMKIDSASTVNTMPVEGGVATELVRIPGDATLRNLTLWTPDGRSLLFSRVDNGKIALWLVPSAGGTARKLDLNISGTVGFDSIRFHPDGRRVAYTTGVNSVELWALERFLPQTGTAAAKH